MSPLLALALLSSPLQLALSEQPAPAPANPAPGQPAPPADDFDLLPKAKAPDAAVQHELTQQLELRRTMLQLHQLGGFITLGAVGATVIVGQLAYADKYGGGGDTGRYRTLHLWMGFGTTAIFAATGALAVFAPSPLPKPVRFDSATVHKTLLAVATALMIAEIALGPVIASKEGQLSQRDWALAHQIVGYAALGVTTTGAAAYIF